MMTSTRTRGLWIQIAAMLAVVASTLSMTATLTGCATLDKDECQAADWRQIGYEDGLRGYRATRIKEHREACAEHGIAPDPDAYRSGHRTGLRDYCTPNRGYQVGLRGKSYRGVCPPEVEPAFLDAYHYGKDVHRARRAVRDASRDLARHERELNEVEADIEAGLDKMAHTRSHRKRHRLRRHIRDLRARKRRLEDRIAEDQLRLDDLTYELDRLKAAARY